MNKCEIIKDLLPVYVENLTSAESNEYIQEHIAKCSECRNILENMRENNLLESEENAKAKEAEIKIIKKYKTKMKILKIGFISIISAILLATIIFVVIHLPTYKILKQSYNSMQELSKANNYKLTTKQIDIYPDNEINHVSTTIQYLKDGKFKRERIGKDGTNLITEFGNETDNIMTYLIEEEKTKSYTENFYKQKYVEYTYYIIVNNSRDIFNAVGKKVRIDSYNGRECYIIRSDYNNDYYSEIWIDKETMMQVRVLDGKLNGRQTEYIYIFELDATTDEDLKINNLDEYSEYVDGI